MRPWRSIVLGLLAALACAGGVAGDEPKRVEGPANRLAGETSPYLLMHAHNPVDWYPWGPEAFAKAKAENKPIFLSIGYSSCYWCHVMERESFMDPAIARALNAGFVAIKVDREERPDVDQVYMAAVQALTGSGGWPMSTFLLPDGRPFYGGTYFPRAEFAKILEGVGEAWRDQRAEVTRDAERLADAVRRSGNRGAGGAGGGGGVALTRELAGSGRAALLEQFDPEFGGFGFDLARPSMRRPKFPEPVNLLYLMDQARRDPAARPDPRAMVDRTLDAMSRGGIRDHLGGGFHRYSTLRDWSVPHFEKMLYDNAQLAEAYLLAFEATGDPRWRIEAEATFAFVARTLTGPDGLFCSALDAESEGEEGKSYVWTRAEVERILGPGPFAGFASFYGMDAKPNFEGDRHVLLEPKPLGAAGVARALELAPSRAQLLAARDRRPRPLLDDKVLTSWNALMIGAYAEGARILKDPKYRDAADKAADALLATMRSADGRLLRTSRGGRAKLAGYLEDYAFLIRALIQVHAASGDPKRLAQARDLADRMIRDFADPEAGGFFYTSNDHESLLVRFKDPFDNAVPGANSVAIRALVGLARATGEARYLDEAGRALRAFAPSLAKRPDGSPLMLLALGEYLDARPEAAGPSSPAAPPAPLPGAPGAVTAEAGEPTPKRVAPGGEFEVAVSLTIKAGYHIYANPAGTDDVIPTTIALAPAAGAALVEARYPGGEAKVLAGTGTARVNVLEGGARVGARIRVALDARAGPLDLVLKVRVQACDDRACLAPATLDVPVRVEVGPR